MNSKLIITLSVICMLMVVLLPPEVDSFFGHALGGLVTDIAVNPLRILGVLILKKLILLKLGLLLLGKRSIDDNFPPNNTYTDNEMTAADYEKMATSLDENGCIAKLICDIMAKDQQNTKFERAIGDYFKSATAEDLSQTSPTASGHSIFHYAAFMGKLARSTDSCDLIFQKCNSSMSEVRKTANVAFELDI